MAHAAADVAELPASSALADALERLVRWLRRPGTIHVIGATVIAGAVAAGIFIPGEFGGPKHGPTGGGGTGPSTTLANEWVNTSAGGSPRRLATPSAFADAAGCNSTCAYSSFSAAWSAAACGDNVLVRNGSTYNAQNIPYTAAKSCSGNCRDAATFQDGSTTTQDFSACITFHPESGAAVTLTRTGAAVADNVLSVETSYFRIIGINTVISADQTTHPFIKIGSNTQRTGVCSNYSNVHDIVVDGMHTSAFYVQAGHYVYLENMDVGPLYININASFSTSFVRGCGDATIVHPDHVVIRGMKQHDYYQPGTNAQTHDECIHWEDGTFGLIEQSKWQNCPQQPISFEPELVTGASVSNLAVRNSVFGPACEVNLPGSACVPIGSLVFNCTISGNGMQNIYVGFNSFDGTALGNGTPAGPSFSPDSSVCSNGPDTVVGNIFPGSCTAPGSGTISNSYNIVGGTCTGTGNATGIGASAIQAFYASPLSPNYNYATTGTPIGFVPAAQGCPATNILGAARTGSTCNAGAY